MTSYKLLLSKALTSLSQSPTPQIDAEILLCDAAGISKEKLLTSGSDTVPVESETRFWHYISLRTKGMPVAYILGRKAFWDFEVEVNRYVLIPRPETECIVEVIQDLGLPSRGVLFELGTGSGALAIALTRVLNDWQIWASDMNEHALLLAKNNARKLDAKIRFIKSNWLSSYTGKANVIVSNPPYVDARSEQVMHDVRAYEPESALFSGEHGLSDLKIITATSVQYLNSGGYLVLEHGYDQGEKVRNRMKKAGFKHIKTKKDLSGLERVTFGCCE